MPHQDLKTAAQQLIARRWQDDLAWCIRSESMLNPELYPASHPESCTHFNADPSSSTSILAAKPELPAALQKLKSHFLGPYFESLWAQAISMSDNLDLLAKGLQIHDQGRTIGEFDLILKSKGHNILIHQELAAKFYLGVQLNQGSPASLSNIAWVGPNAIDRFDLKAEKLLEQQRLLSQNPVAKRVLATHLDAWGLLPTTPLTSEIVMKGYLFHPLGTTLPLPTRVNPRVNQGHWLPISALPEIRDRHVQWKMLSRLEWLAPCVLRNEAGVSFQELHTKLLETPGRASLVAGFDGERPTNGRLEDSNETAPISESARYVIVPDDWTDEARSSVARTPLTAYY